MSTGERSIVMTLVKILYAIMENEDRHLFFYLDEPDIFLHPEWQRRFIDALTTLTSNKAIQKRLSSL